MVGINKLQTFIDCPRQMVILLILHKLYVNLMLDPAGDTALLDLLRFP